MCIRLFSNSFRFENQVKIKNETKKKLDGENHYSNNDATDPREGG